MDLQKRWTSLERPGRGAVAPHESTEDVLNIVRDFHVEAWRTSRARITGNLPGSSEGLQSPDSQRIVGDSPIFPFLKEMGIFPMAKCFAPSQRNRNDPHCEDQGG